MSHHLLPHESLYRCQVSHVLATRILSEQIFFTLFTWREWLVSPDSCSEVWPAHERYMEIVAALQVHRLPALAADSPEAPAAVNFVVGVCSEKSGGSKFCLARPQQVLGCCPAS